TPASPLVPGEQGRRRRRSYEKPDFAQDDYTWRSAFVAAAFALHPLHVESVAWISERKDVLSTFFWLATMIAYVAYAWFPTVWRYLLVMMLFALGLLAKPMLVSLPVVLLLMD